MSKSKKAISLAVSFLLTLLLCVWLLLGTALSTVYQPDFISKNIDDRYAERAYESLMLQWETLGGPSGFPSEVMRDIIGSETIAVGVQEYTHAIWGGNAAYEVKTTHIKEKLMTAFTAYASSKDYVIDEEVTQALSDAADACVKAYVRHINIPALRAAAKLVNQSKRLMILVFMVLSVLLAAMVFLSARIHRYWFHGTKDVVYTLFATTLVLAPPSIIVLATDPMASINLSPAYLRWLLSDAVDSVMWRLLIFAIIGLLIGVALLVISERQHRKTFHREKREPGALVMANERRYRRAHRQHSETPRGENPRHGRKNSE